MGMGEWGIRTCVLCFCVFHFPLGVPNAREMSRDTLLKGPLKSSLAGSGQRPREGRPPIRMGPDPKGTDALAAPRVPDHLAMAAP